MGRNTEGKTLAEKALSTKSVYINDINAQLWNKFIGLTKMIDVNQTPAIEEALQLYIEKHKRDIVL
jgi:hypothetical protein